MLTILIMKNTYIIFLGFILTIGAVSCGSGETTSPKSSQTPPNGSTSQIGKSAADCVEEKDGILVVLQTQRRLDGLNSLSSGRGKTTFFIDWKKAANGCEMVQFARKIYAVLDFGLIENLQKKQSIFHANFTDYTKDDIVMRGAVFLNMHDSVAKLREFLLTRPGLDNPNVKAGIGPEAIGNADEAKRNFLRNFGLPVIIEADWMTLVPTSFFFNFKKVTDRLTKDDFTVRGIKRIELNDNRFVLHKGVLFVDMRLPEAQIAERILALPKE